LIDLLNVIDELFILVDEIKRLSIILK